jgi:hypothetical protein
LKQALPPKALPGRDDPTIVVDKTTGHRAVFNHTRLPPGGGVVPADMNVGLAPNQENGLRQNCVNILDNACGGLAVQGRFVVCGNAQEMAQFGQAVTNLENRPT